MLWTYLSMAEEAAGPTSPPPHPESPPFDPTCDKRIVEKQGCSWQGIFETMFNFTIGRIYDENA
jgi:hypothetical protein